MPTTPYKDVLYRELSIIQFKAFKPSPSDLLQELVNFGTNAFIRCITSVDQEKNVHLAPFTLYRQNLEFTDGIEILVSNAAPSCALPLLRSTFESLLFLEYILEDDEQYQKRSLAWLVFYLKSKLHSYNSLLPKTNEGDKFAAAIANDKSVKSFPLPPQDLVSSSVENLVRLLSEEQFRDIVAEYDSKRPRYWYSLFGGLPNLYKLAEHLKRTAQYEVLYRAWSATVHASDFSPFLAPNKDGEVGIRGLRDLSLTFQVTTFATTFILEATRLLVHKYRHDEDLTNWYIRDVRDAYMQFAKAHTDSKSI